MIGRCFCGKIEQRHSRVKSGTVLIVCKDCRNKRKKEKNDEDKLRRKVHRLLQIKMCQTHEEE